MPTTEYCVLCEREITQTMKESRTWNLGARPWHHDAFQDGSDHLLERKGGDTRFLLC
jgi:hypothetical protein